MECFSKQYFIKQCHFCQNLDIKRIDIKTKDVYIKCCFKEKQHNIIDLKESPKECPYYLERFVLSNN